MCGRPDMDTSGISIEAWHSRSPLPNQGARNLTTTPHEQLRFTTTTHTSRQTHDKHRQHVGRGTISAMLRQEEDRDGCRTLQGGQGIGEGQRQASLARRATGSAIQGL